MSDNPDIRLGCSRDAKHRNRNSQLATRSPQLVGHALRLLRKRRGWSQAELSDRVGINRTYLSQLENGELSEQLKRLLDILNELQAEIIIRDIGS
jgi:DNA-binding XRE family transcriptional regulator